MTTGAIMTTHQYGYVTGTYLLPDRTPATRLRVLLTPVRVMLDEPPATLLRTATKCYVGQDGQIRKVGSDEHPVPLVPGLYEVSFAGMTNPSVPAPFIVEVTTGHTQEAPLDLPRATPIPAPGPMAEIVRGASAYEIAVSHGFEGTEVEWLASLIGGGEGGVGLISYSQVSGLPDYPQVFPADLSGLTPASIGAQPAGEYLTMADLPEIPELPDLSGLVHTDDPRLSDAREPTEHDHPEYQPAGDYLTAEDLPEAPDLSGYVRTVNGQGPDEDGNVTVEGGGSGGGGAAPGPWTAVPEDNDIWGGLYYRLEGDVVRLAGEINPKRAMAQGSTLAQLPTGARPSAIQNIMVVLSKDGTNPSYSPARLSISTLGILTLRPGIASDQRIYVDGITFHLTRPW